MDSTARPIGPDLFIEAEKAVSLAGQLPFAALSENKKLP